MASREQMIYLESTGLLSEEKARSLLELASLWSNGIGDATDDGNGINEPDVEMYREHYDKLQAARNKNSYELKQATGELKFEDQIGYSLAVDKPVLKERIQGLKMTEERKEAESIWLLRESANRLSVPRDAGIVGKSAKERHFEKLNQQLCVEYENLEKRYSDGVIAYKKYLEEKSKLALRSAKLSTQEIDIQIDSRLRTGELVMVVAK